MTMHTNPVRMKADWVDSDAEESVGEQVTRRGRHHVQEFVDRKKEENSERRAKYLRDAGGNIPPPEHQESGRTWKSSSKVRFPSRAYRRGYELVDWGA